jgi:hypothetical protein
MKLKNYFYFLTFGLVLLVTLPVIQSCSSDEEENIPTVAEDPEPDPDPDPNDPGYVLNVSENGISFDETNINTVSTSKNVTLTGEQLTSEISLVTEGNYTISLNDTDFFTELTIPTENVNGQHTIYIKFTPQEVGVSSGKVIVSNAETTTLNVNLNGIGVVETTNVQTFEDTRVAFGGGYEQTATQTFNMLDDLSDVSKIKMFVKLRCPSGGCDEWDVYANVRVKDDASGEFFEMGRYITPYWNDNSQLDRGFEFDVTDFKSLLSGTTELRIKTECWNADGYLISVDFDYEHGGADYPYYAISRVMAYNNSSIDGVPYGVDHNLDLDKSINIPANAESTHLRTIISGWGHASPYDAGGRPCAEWCFRTHAIKINGAATFQHSLEPLGCAQNPVSNQAPGNWQPDRAGWCPGMEVPTRIDQFDNAMAGNTFTYEYDYEDWTNDGSNGDAYYATSTFVVVKSNTPIDAPIVND